MPDMMRIKTQFACTPAASGTFDFFTNLITLYAPIPSDYWRVQAAMANRAVFVAGGPDGRIAREHRATLVHEVTHYLDATVSMWGLEYNARKARAANLLQTAQDVAAERGAMSAENLSVFRLNTAEINAHVAFVDGHRPRFSLNSCELDYGVSIHPVYGPLVTVIFHHGADVPFQVPLSMLAVLEAHAYANETLSKILCARMLANEAERAAVMEEIRVVYHKHMDNTGIVEYTLLLQLMNRCAVDLELEFRLRVLCAIVRLVLDADALQMSHFVSGIAGAFAPGDAGDAALRDMCRGSSRAVMAFETIKLLGRVYRSFGEFGRAQMNAELSVDPFGCVSRVLTENDLLVNIPVMRQSERQICLDEIDSHGVLYDPVLIRVNDQFNKPLLVDQTCADVLESLWLPDASDPTKKHALQFPNRVDLDDFSPNGLTLLNRLHSKMQENPVERFFA